MTVKRHLSPSWTGGLRFTAYGSRPTSYGQGREQSTLVAIVMSPAEDHFWGKLLFWPQWFHRVETTK